MRPVGLAAIAMLGLTACTDETLIEVERPFFDDPPAMAGGFLGYDEAAENLTVCGNCHIGQQSEWEETDHADAWLTLQNSGQAREVCEACHTVGPNGNPVSQPAGWATTRDPRYQDVQCESCHGPGQTHIMNPDATQPLAFLAVGLDLDRGCAECHQGTHQPFVEEWSQSAHARVVETAAGRAECQACHRGQAILEAWGVKADYVEKEAAEHLPITCGVCHDPHDATNAGQLRFPVQNVAVEQHLCARCHNRRTSPDPSSTRLEPHAPEADLLQGVAGWFPPDIGFDPGQIRATHGSVANPSLCAKCHVNRHEVTDEETGAFVLQSTGHLFEAIPCLDAEGIPVPGGDCALTVEARSFDGCMNGACHGSEDAAVSALVVASNRIADLAETLHALLEEVDPGLTDPDPPISGADGVFTIAEGALFNHALATFGGDVRGATVHNPFLIEALLVGSIDAVEVEYGVQAAGAVGDWKVRLKDVLRRAGR